MKTFQGFSSERLAEIIKQFAGLRVAVVGDFFLDKYLDIEPSLAEVSIETGKTAHQVVAVRHSPGAAGTVVCNLASLAAGTVFAIGFTGDDGESYELRKDLAELDCNTDHLHRDPQRMTPTYLKPRDRTVPGLDGEHQRYDTKNRQPTSPALQQQLVDSLDAVLSDVDAVIAMDQVEEEECGGVTSLIRHALADRAKRFPQITFWGDSRRRIHQFRNLVIKPNQFEAMGQENPLPEDRVDDIDMNLDELREVLPRLRAETGAAVFATCGSGGIMVSDPEPTWVPAVRLDEPTDPTGAGDSVTAAAVLALAAGADFPEAALLGNLVASITVEQLATTGTARPDQLPDRLAMWYDLH